MEQKMNPIRLSDVMRNPWWIDTTNRLSYQSVVVIKSCWDISIYNWRLLVFTLDHLSTKLKTKQTTPTFLKCFYFISNYGFFE